MAGSKRAHSRTKTPGNKNLATIQAVEMPNDRLRMDTPNINIRVLTVYRGKTVAIWCDQRPPLSPSDTFISAANGPIKKNTKTRETSGQPQKYFSNRTRELNRSGITNQLDL